MLRQLFFLLIVRPLVLVVLGLNVRRRHLLPISGPAVIVANHNSHLDTLVLMSLFPQRLIPKIHPVAAADYFLRNRFLSWFACDLMGIIPLERRSAGKGAQVLAPVGRALEEGAILILFPEGTRGEPEQMSKLKNGVAHLISEHPDVPVVPVFLHGSGKCLPKGEIVLVPFFVDVFVGEALHWPGNRHEFMATLEAGFGKLQQEARVVSEGSPQPGKTEPTPGQS